MLERGRFAIILDFLDTAESICKKTSQDQFKVMSDYHAIAGAYALEVNDTETSAKNTRLYLELRVRHATNPQEPLKLAHAYRQAANVSLAKGKVEQAIELYRRSIGTHRSIPGDTEIDRSLVVIHLGLAYWIAGRHDEAAEGLTTNLAAREAEYGTGDNKSFQWVRHGSVPSSTTDTVLTVLAACCML
jgi:tetratricopeptide (TPR) repeat protein